MCPRTGPSPWPPPWPRWSSWGGGPISVSGSDDRRPGGFCGRDALAALDLTGLAERYFDELSGGEKQKALLARALAQETRILLLDEPTSNLDLRHQLEVLDLLDRLEGVPAALSLAVSLHDLNLAARYADDLVLLHQGRVAALGEPGPGPDPGKPGPGVRGQGPGGSWTSTGRPRHHEVEAVPCPRRRSPPPGNTRNHD